MFIEQILPYHEAMTLYYCPCGPLIRYGNGLLQIQDLNPEVKTQWRMSRSEMLRFGWRCLVAAIRHSREQ
jgi:hypothetical protein